MATVTPTWSDLIRQRWGMNVHYSWTTTVYGNSSTVTSLLKELNLGLVRDRVATSGPQLTQLPILYAAGIKLHGTISVYNETTQPQLDNYVAQIAAHPQYYASIGGVNEPNNESGGRLSNWATITRNQQVAIWDTLNTAGLGSIPVSGPSLKDNVSDLQSDFAALQATDIYQYMDYGDFHKYPLGGGGTATPSNQMQQRANWASAAFHGKPLFCTETGMNNAINKTPEWVTGIYAPRLLMEAMKAGAERVWFYELLDDPDSTGLTLESHFGLVATPVGSVSDPSQWRKKAAFHAMKSLMQQLADPGSPVTPASLNLTVTSPTSDTKWMCVGKRDGTVLLILWRDVSVWNGTTRTEITVKPVDVTIVSDLGTQTVSLAATLQVINLGTGAAATIGGSGGAGSTTGGTTTGGTPATDPTPTSTPAGSSPRRAYDRDGTLVGTVTGSTFTAAASQDVKELNSSSASGGIAVGSTDWLTLVFPTLITISGLFAASGASTDESVDLQTSPDTTDGVNGTWTTIGKITLHPGSGVTSGSWLDLLVDGLAINARGLRIAPGTSYWRTLHIYGGGESQDPPGLKIRSSAYAIIPLGTINWGSVPLGSSADTTIVVANNSANTAHGVILTVETAEDAVDWAEQHYLSLDGRTFADQVSLGTISPFSRSAVVTVRRVVPDGATTGPHAARLVAAATSWT